MTTPTTMLLTEAAPILAALENIQRQLAALNADTHPAHAAADPEPAWLYPAGLARRFGMKRRAITYHISAAREAGSVRTLTPPTPTGTPGRPLYNVADFEAWLARPALFPTH